MAIDSAFGLAPAAQHGVAARQVGDVCNTALHGTSMRVKEACVGHLSGGRVEGCLDVKQEDPETKDVVLLNGCDGVVRVVGAPPADAPPGQYEWNADLETWVSAVPSAPFNVLRASYETQQPYAVNTDIFNDFGLATINADPLAGGIALQVSASCATVPDPSVVYTRNLNGLGVTLHQDVHAVVFDLTLNLGVLVDLGLDPPAHDKLALAIGVDAVAATPGALVIGGLEIRATAAARLIDGTIGLTQLNNVVTLHAVLNDLHDGDRIYFLVASGDGTDNSVLPRGQLHASLEFIVDTPPVV